MSKNDAAGQGQATLILRDLASGKEREIYTANARFLTCGWPTEPNRVLCGEAAQETTQILSIALNSAQEEWIRSIPGQFIVIQASRDGGALYLIDLANALLRWEATTGETSILSVGLWSSPSNDENWLVRRNDAKSVIEVRRSSGGDWTTIASDVTSWTWQAFTPDSGFVLYTKSDAGKPSLFRVAITGGEPERLGDYSRGQNILTRVSPDGKKILAATYTGAKELSIIENFVPDTARATKTAAH